MRIVDVNEFYSPTGGGVRTYVEAKMRILGEMGHELIVIAPERAERVEERPGGRIHTIAAPPMPFDRDYGLFWDAAPIDRLLDRYDPDVIENCSPWRPAWIVGRNRRRAVTSYFFHNDNMEAYAKRWLRRFAAERTIERGFAWYDRYMSRMLAPFDTVVTNGPSLTRRLRARGTRIDATATLGIERAAFSPAHRDEALRAAMLADLGLPPEATLLLAIGRHHPEKNWPVVLEAVARAGVERPVGLVLMGRGQRTGQLERLARYMPNVRLIEPEFDRARFAAMLASADGFIHGNDAEPFGLAVSEALAAGVPLIVPDRGGAFEVAGPAYAELFRACDPLAATAAIGRLLDRDQAGLRRAAAAAGAAVPSDEEHVAGLVDHYRGVIAARRGPQVATAVTK